MGASDYAESFGSWLKRKIADLGINQRQAALKMGATSGMMSEWVNNNKRPSPAYCERIAAVLGVPYDEVMIRAGYRPRRDTDLDPKRAELVNLAHELPLSEADLAIGFMKWRLSELYRPKQHAPPREGSPSVRKDTDESGGQAAS